MSLATGSSPRQRGCDGAPFGGDDGSGGASTRTVRILLIEPQFVLRRTILAVGRDLGLGEIDEATSVESAQPLLARQAFDGLVLDIGSGERALPLLGRLRAGEFRSAAETPVIALVATEADAAPGGRLAPYAVVRTLRKPFKVAELLQAIEQIGAGGVGAE